MADERRVTAAFGNLRLAHVVHHVKIVVRHFADEHVRPVVARERNLFPRREFETAVGAEMHHRISFKSMADIEIGCDVGVRRRHFDAVDELALLLAFAGERLRHQDDVAEPDPPEFHVPFRRAE